MTRSCIVVADAARARIYSYQQLDEPGGANEKLVELRDLVDPARHQQFDDHSQSHVEQLDLNFAGDIADAVELITRDQGYRKLIIVASSSMFGNLRDRLGPFQRSGLEIVELERNFVKLTISELLERLRDLGALPPYIRPHSPTHDTGSRRRDVH